jgi:hypothetical protein
MLKRIPTIQILTGLYIISIALYMMFNHPTEAWKNYYWIVNKLAMLMALGFNYKRNKTKSDWTFINFLFIQTSLIVLYFTFGLPYFYKWMQVNDAVIYSFVIGGFIAVSSTWFYSICKARGLFANVCKWFRTFRRAKK